MTCGIADHLGGLALDQDLAEIEHDGASGSQRHHDFHDMLDHQHGDAGIAHLAHQVDAGFGLDRRQPRQHLVEQQQLWFGRERPRHFEPALFRRHQVAGEHAGAGAETAEFQHLVCLAARHAHHGVADQRADDDVVDHAHGLETLDDLKGAADAAHAAFRRRQPGRPRHRTRSSLAWAASTPAIRLNSVDLPEPLGPIKPTISPRPTEIETSLLATRPPERLPDAPGFQQRRHRAASLRFGENSPIRPCGCASEIATISVP